MKPTIYCYINNRVGPDAFAVVALAEDGAMLAAHTSSSEVWAMKDIGATDPVTPIGLNKHRVFGEHYPDGYRVEWVPADVVPKHAGVRAALAAHVPEPPTKEAA